jgi:hypothetical protein
VATPTLTPTWSDRAASDIGFDVSWTMFRERPFVEILDEPAAVRKAGEHVVAGQLIRLGLGLPPAHDLVAQVDCAANRVNLGGDTEENEKDHQPVDHVVLRFVGELDELVESVVADGKQIDREPDETDDDQVARDSTLP